ncbi:MAG: ABC transporter ATP-binding protein [Candidatus Magasanikbacteria bacterium]|nr:ABC transporter ATP-binding protein [Candidatus Magasanikbacteria bacterium]
MQTRTRSTLRKYFSVVRRFKWSGLFMVAAIISATAIGSLIPLWFKRFFDVLSGPGASAGGVGFVLLDILLAIAILETLRWASWRMTSVISPYFFSNVMAELAKICFAYIHRHSFSFFNNNFVGSLVKRANYFVNAFERITDKLLYNLLSILVHLMVIMIVLFQRNTIIGLAIAAWIVGFLIVNWFLAKYKLKYDIERSNAETKSTAYLADSITNNNNIKLFTGYWFELGAYSKLIDIVNRWRVFTWNLDAIFEAIQGFLIVALELGAFYLAIGLWQEGKITIGDFVLLQTYVVIIFNQIWDIGKIFRNLYTDLADAEEMTTILDTPHEIQDIPKAKPLQVTEGKIVFKNVDFYYHETRKIFSKLNLTIAPHEKVALVGPSGAGKSTVVKLLLRMHEISAGAITIDGQKINRVTQESLWQVVSLVPQDPILFHRTLMENIRYGRGDATDEQVFRAAKLAHCDEFIMEFPDKYSTYVGERGVKLSGGERQRVAIARAILRDAPILVLDEATSSLDSESEALIQDALKNLMREKTVIVIAHRLSTIMTMDRIIVVEKGKIVEEGTHNELLKKKKGIYRGLWKIQAGGFLRDVAAAEPEEAGLDEKQEKDYDEESSEE